MMNNNHPQGQSLLMSFNLALFGILNIFLHQCELQQQLLLPDDPGTDWIPMHAISNGLLNLLLVL
jgi:hypothetical protein